MKSISALCCRHRSNLVARVKRKHAFSRVLRWSQICHSERQALIFVKAKSLSGKPAALEDITAFHLDFSGEKRREKQGLLKENGPGRHQQFKCWSFFGGMVVCKRLILCNIYYKIYSHLKFLLICTYRFKLACWSRMCNNYLIFVEPLWFTNVASRWQHITGILKLYEDIEIVFFLLNFAYLLI